MAVFRPGILQPAAIKSHEVPKPPGIGIPGMLDERGEPGRQHFRQTLLAGIVERARQQQRAGIVVDAIAMGAVRHAVHGMLKKAGVVAHRQEMVDLHFRRSAAVAQQRAGVRARDRLEPMSASGILEHGHIALGGPLPGHRAAARIGALAHGLPQDIVRQQLRDLTPMAAASPNGTRMPRPSASNSRACQYGVETTAFPSPKL